MKRIILIIGLIFVLFIGVGSGGIYYLSRDLEGMNDVVIGSVDLEEVTDGTYQGTFTHGRFTNTVEVTIVNHEIINLSVTNDLRFSKEEVKEAFIEQVLLSQSLDIDGVAGGTVSIKAYSKALENALGGSN